MHIRWDAGAQPRMPIMVYSPSISGTQNGGTKHLYKLIDIFSGLGFQESFQQPPPQNSLIEKGDQENPPKIEGTEKVFTQVPYHGS